MFFNGVYVSSTIEDLLDFGLPGPFLGTVVASIVFEGVSASAPTIDDLLDFGLPGPRFGSAVPFTVFEGV